MDWLRRNWPDLLIGVALVAVIAGIVVTLLGGSIFDSLRGASRAPDVSPLQLPAASEELQEPVSPLAATPSTETAGETAVDVVVLDATTPGEVVSPLGEATAPAPLEEARGSPDATPSVVLLQPEGASDASPESEILEAETLEAEPLATETLIPVEPAEAPPLEVATPATVTAAAAEPWRIAVGSFRNRDNAERRAEEYRAEGHPVSIGVEGDISVVLVGPFADEAETLSLAESFRRDGGEAFVYRYDPDPEAAVETVETSVAATTASPEPSSTATDTATTTEAPTEAPTETTATGATSATAVSVTGPASSSRYLQVGAFNHTASAEPRKQRLESMGYEVLSRTDDSGVVRLLIGPFDGEEMRNARERLDTQDIEHFPVD
jgi:cell division protein FtsN